MQIKKLLFLYLQLKNNHIEMIIRWKIIYRMINIDNNVATKIIIFRRIFLYHVFTSALAFAWCMAFNESTVRSFVATGKQPACEFPRLFVTIERCIISFRCFGSIVGNDITILQRCDFLRFSFDNLSKFTGFST